MHKPKLKPSDRPTHTTLADDGARTDLVWSCQELTTATLCSMVLQPAASRSFNVCRTVPLWSFFRRQGDHTPSHYFASCTGCRSNSGSHTRWLFWRSKSVYHFDANIPGPPHHNTRQCTDSALDNEYTAVWAVRSYRLRQARFPLFGSTHLERYAKNF